MDKLYEILKHAINTVDYYSDLKKNISETDYKLSGEELLLHFPILSKSDVSNNEELFISRGYNIHNLIQRTTSGSTGVPLKCYKSHMDVIKSGMTLWKRRSWYAKVFPNDKRATFFLRMYNSNDNNFIIKKESELLLSTLDLSLDRLHLYCDALEEFNPKWVFGPPSALYYLANFIESQGLKLNLTNLEFIELAGEFCDEEQRKYVSDIFKCNVSNMYGAKETWLIAYSCPHNHMHIAEDNVFVEIITIDGIQEVVLTSLNSYAMPLIRYKVGDTGSLIQKSCQYPGRIIEILGGRTNSFFKYKNKVLSAANFHVIIRDLHREFRGVIGQYQVHRIGPIDFKFFFIPGNLFLKEHLEYLDRLMRETFDSDLNIHYVKTNHIDYSTSGKISYFIDNYY